MAFIHTNPNLHMKYVDLQIFVSFRIEGPLTCVIHCIIVLTTKRLYLKNLKGEEEGSQSIM